MPELSIRICKMLRNIPSLQVFSAETLSRIADQMREVHLRAGELIVQLGVDKDSFYLSADGFAQAEHDGSRTRELEPGDHFFGQSSTDRLRPSRRSDPREDRRRPSTPSPGQSFDYLRYQRQAVRRSGSASIS